MSVFQFLTEHWLLASLILMVIIFSSKKKISKIYKSRREAFREAKRDNGVSMSMQPTAVIRPNESEKKKKWAVFLDFRNIRMYIFSINDRKVYIREDKAANYNEKNGEGDQPTHFNAGDDPENLKQHYYFEDDKN